MYDIEKIKEELKPVNVIHYLGIPYRRSGKNLFILCPEHEERTGMADRHIGNCVLGDRFYNAYHCFGCGASGNCFKLIALLQGLDMKKDFSEILRIAAEACGGSSLFETSAPKTRKIAKEKKKDIQSLPSKSSLDTIGLSGNGFACTYTEVFDRNENPDMDCLIRDVDFGSEDRLGFPEVSYLRPKAMAYSLSVLAGEDREAYDWLLKSKSADAMKRYRRLAHLDWKQAAGKAADPTDASAESAREAECFAEETKDFYKSKYLEAENIWKQFASDEEIEGVDDGWVFGYDDDDMTGDKEPGMAL